MADFTPVPALVGGAIIGAAASLLLLGNGRIAGIAGALGGLLPPDDRAQAPWRLAFLLGLALVGALLSGARPELFENQLRRSLPLLLAGGVVVGFGTQLGSGCTSGHGVCGISRFSKRSIVATCVFMATGMATVFVLGQLGVGVVDPAAAGGAP
jgi:uncharacterized membrane protein YedE/YeeE